MGIGGVAERAGRMRGIADEYLRWLLAASPVAGTVLGDPAGNATLGNLSADAFQSHIAELDRLHRELSQIGPDGFPPEDLLDMQLLLSNLDAERRRLTQNQDWLKNPALYLTLLLEGAVSLLRRTDDVLPVLPALASRLLETKVALAAARTNVANPARVFT